MFYNTVPLNARRHKTNGPSEKKNIIRIIRILKGENPMFYCVPKYVALSDVIQPDLNLEILMMT